MVNLYKTLSNLGVLFLIPKRTRLTLGTVVILSILYQDRIARKEPRFTLSSLALNIFLVIKMRPLYPLDFGADSSLTRGGKRDRLFDLFG